MSLVALLEAFVLVGAALMFHVCEELVSVAAVYVGHCQDVLHCHLFLSQLELLSYCAALV